MVVDDRLLAFVALENFAFLFDNEPTLFETVWSESKRLSMVKETRAFHLPIIQEQLWAWILDQSRNIVAVVRKCVDHITLATVCANQKQ